MSNTAALMMSNAALAESSKAHDIACQSMMQGYTHITATVQQSQEYASCVKRLHPDNMTPTEMIVVKVLILIVFASTGIKIYIDRNDHWTEWWMSAILGFCIGAAGILVLGLLVAALAFLFA